MSEQLTLADVEHEQFFINVSTGEKFWFKNRFFSDVQGHRYLFTILRMRDCYEETIGPIEASQMKVELMELVPKDRHKYMLEALEAAKEFMENISIPRGGAYYHVLAEIANHKGESA